MRLRPRITSPCPLKFGALPQPGADFCNHCERRVHNLEALDDVARADLLASCNRHKICVAYTVPRTRGLLLAGAGLALLAGCATTPENSAADAQPLPPPELDAYFTLMGTVEGDVQLMDVDDTQTDLVDLPRGHSGLWLDEDEAGSVEFVAGPAAASRPSGS